MREALLQRENAALSIENSELAGGERVETQAARLGMQLVPDGALRFLTAIRGRCRPRGGRPEGARAHRRELGRSRGHDAGRGQRNGQHRVGPATEPRLLGEAPATAATQPTSATGESGSSLVNRRTHLGRGRVARLEPGPGFEPDRRDDVEEAPGRRRGEAGGAGSGQPNGGG